jgi:hypothetical protein
MSDMRFVQFGRIYGVEPSNEFEARALVSGDAVRLADALFAEAADSDDVTGAASARAYLDERLRYLGGLVDRAAVDMVRARFEQRLQSWG